MTLRRSTGLLNKLAGLPTTKSANSDFSSGITGWTVGASTSGVVSASKLTLAATTGGADGTVYQDVATVVGRTYRVVYTMRTSVGTDGGYVQAGALRSGIYTGTTDSVLAFAFVADTTITRLTLGAHFGTAGNTVIFSGAKVQEVNEGFQGVMDHCSISVYSGSQPAAANDAKNGTLLYTISKDGAGVDGLTWDNAVAGAVSKKTGELWRGTAVSAGVAGWFRCSELGTDPAIASTTAARFDGSISTSGSAEITMANTTVELDSVQSITAFTYNQIA